MVVYISRRFEADVGAQVHKSILDEIYGENNVFTFDLRPITPKSENRYICYGKYKTIFERLIRWMQGNSMYISNQIIHEICDIFEEIKPELVFLEESDLGNLTKAIKRKFPHIKIVCFYHDIGADLFRQWADKSSLVGKIENYICIKQEYINQKYTDEDIVFHKRDAELYQKFYQGSPEHIMPLSTYVKQLPDEFVKASVTTEQTKKKLLFVGTKYYPNIEGIRWFYTNVLPNLGDNIELNIVGRGTEQLTDEFTDQRVRVLGTVDDISEYYYDADIVIAPLFSGGGMKLKSMEAISMGKCLVGNEESLVGFWENMDETVRNRIVYNCKTKDEWVQVLNQLAKQKIHKFNPELYTVFINNFSYSCTKNAFMKMLGIKED